MKKIEAIKWMILPVDTLQCMICGDVATRRVTIPWEISEVNLCLCMACAWKSAEEILKEVMNNE